MSEQAATTARRKYSDLGGQQKWAFNRLCAQAEDYCFTSTVRPVEPTDPEFSKKIRQMMADFVEIDIEGESE